MDISGARRLGLNILVCGSEGSLMGAIIPYLLEMNHNVRGIDNFFRYGRNERKRDYEFIEGDLCNIDLAKRVCKGIDIIFQGAARIFGVGGFHKYPADILSKDTSLHQNIIWEALNNNVEKVVYISSSMVYERDTNIPSKESDVEDMPVPLTDYGLSKLMCERLCRAFHKQYGLKYTIWRPFNIITPFEEAAEEPGISHVFADFIKKIVLDRQNPMEILGNGEQIRCFTWIKDVASAIAGYSLHNSTDNEVFNLGNPEPVTMRELALKIHKSATDKGIIPKTGQLSFTYLPTYEDDVKVRIPSIEKAKTLLQWEPKVKLDEALDQCLEVVLNRDLHTN
jgi:UDP-glucose 4-epimerase